MYKVMITAGKCPFLCDFGTHFLPKYSFAVFMATGRKLDQRRVDYFVLRFNNQDMKVSGKSVTMAQLCMQL